MTATVWLVIKALLTLLPLVVNAVRDGRIRTGAQKEVVDAVKEKFDARIDAAVAAGNESHDDRVPDPNDRANRR